MRPVQRSEKSSNVEQDSAGSRRVRNNRRTNALNDASFAGNSRRIQSPRRLTMAVPQSEAARKYEVEENNDEMSILYDKYLQTLMTEHIMKEKETAREQKMLTTLTSLEKENVECELKLHEMKMKKSKLEPLNELQQYLENKTREIQTFLVTSELEVVKILDTIYASLKSYDKLVCENVILPGSDEELMEMHNLLGECHQLLNIMCSTISNNFVEVVSTNDSFQKFKKLNTITEKLMDGLHHNLKNIQVDVLKKGSVIFGANNI